MGEHLVVATVPFTFGVPETITLFASTTSKLQIDLPFGASFNGLAA
jgi:hypothetical protein